MATAIPKQPKKEQDQITIRLDRDVVQTLEHYCRYLESGRDYVINQCLTFIFRKDKAFAMWLAGQGIASSPTISGAAAETARIEILRVRMVRFRDAFPSVIEVQA
jgi:hypothetical protein